MKLKEIRRQRGMTAEDVAREMGVTQAAVSNWENGIRDPNIKTLLRLLQVLNCSADELLGIERKPPIESAS